MEIKITRIEEVEESYLIDIEIPYYYKYVWEIEYVYGKIERNKHTQISVRRDIETKFELFVKEQHAESAAEDLIDAYEDDFFDDDKNKSSEEEFIKAKAGFLELAKNLL